MPFLAPGRSFLCDPRHSKIGFGVGRCSGVPSVESGQRVKQMALKGRSSSQNPTLYSLFHKTWTNWAPEFERVIWVSPKSSLTQTKQIQQTKHTRIWPVSVVKRPHLFSAAAAPGTLRACRRVTGPIGRGPQLKRVLTKTPKRFAFDMSPRVVRWHARYARALPFHHFEFSFCSTRVRGPQFGM